MVRDKDKTERKLTLLKSNMFESARISGTSEVLFEETLRLTKYLGACPGWGDDEL